MGCHDASDECPVCGRYWRDGGICDDCYAEQDAHEQDDERHDDAQEGW
jgi:hypothetical protein